MAGLWKSLGGRAVVRGVDLALHPGEVLGLLGPNGAGKTTTLRLAAGIARPDRGRVLLGGRDVTGWPLHRRAQAGLGYLAQARTVFSGLSVAQNLDVVFERRELSRRDRRLRRDCLLEEYGLSGLEGARAGVLSGGQRRRLEVARALAAGPAVLLLDEPFAGLDPLGTADVREVIERVRGRGLAVLLSDHDARAVLASADRVALMHRGQLVVRGTPAEVAASKQARALYFGCPQSSAGALSSDHS